jgi:hypothetical protein
MPELRHTLRTAAACVVLGMSAADGQAISAVYSVTIDGPDAIFLAGRTDLTIPDPSLSWTGPDDHLIRHGGATPEEAKEQLPSWVPVAGGDVIRALDPAIGGVNFFNGFGPPYFGPGGNGASGSSLSSLGGISGYIGPQGPLTGVFLDNSIPDGAAPPTLDFSPLGIGIDFPELSPLLGQVFYIGDGKTAGGEFQKFNAPGGATRLFLGIPDGFGFVGAPGAYDDNDGAYTVRIGVNSIPTVPDGGSLLPSFAAAVALLGLLRTSVAKQR